MGLIESMPDTKMLTITAAKALLQTACKGLDRIEQWQGREWPPPRRVTRDLARKTDLGTVALPSVIQAPNVYQIEFGSPAELTTFEHTHESPKAA